MGHLMESLVLAEYFINQGVPIYFIINNYKPSRLELQKKRIAFVEYELEEIDDIIGLIKQKNVQNIIINHRNASLNNLERIYSKNYNVVVIDQLGDKSIICDFLINKSFVPQWLKYNFPANQPLCCFGPDYAILSDDYRKLHQENKTFSKERYTVLVSMGGVDRTGATFRIIEALRPIENISKEIIIGNGFAHLKELKQLRKNINDSSFNFSVGVNNLHERMNKADIVISAGGNTLFELACVGTPGIVLWEDEHERIHGNAFAEKEIVQCLGNGISTPIKTISNSVRILLKDVDRRKYMSKQGRETVDGCGKDRVGAKIMQLNKIH